MAVFDDNQAPTQETPPTPENPLEKRIADKDAYIAQLEAEAAERNADIARLAEEAKRKDEIEALLETARKNALVTPPQVKDGKPPVETPAQPDAEELVERVKESLKREQTDKVKVDNLKATVDHLVVVYGSEDKAKEVVQQKANELGVSVKFLQDAAAQSPKAFYELLGAKGTPKSEAAPRSEKNTAALNNAPGMIKEGTHAYYQQLRREDPKTYYSARIQQQKMRDALQKGDSFYA